MLRKFALGTAVEDRKRQVVSWNLREKEHDSHPLEGLSFVDSHSYQTIRFRQ